MALSFEEILQIGNLLTKVITYIGVAHHGAVTSKLYNLCGATNVCTVEDSFFSR